MGKSAYQGANSLRDADQASVDQWLTDWQQLPLGSRTMLPKSCDAELEALIQAIGDNNQRAFMPRRSPPEDAKDVIFIHNDSAGKRAPASWRALHKPLAYYQQQ